MTDDEFWSATKELKLIHQWARSRYTAPWAVLGAVLLRVLASSGPHVQLPGVIGGRASLNLGVVFVGPSGAGKGNSDRVAREAWPTQEFEERPLGSGEGIAALFQKPKDEAAKRITRAIFSAGEIDTLTGIAARQGSILLAQLKSALMGELIGQSNASEATSRVVAAHSYRCCLSIGAQPGHAGVVFNDTTGGTPQRLLWLPTTDPTMPADRTPPPDALDSQLPGLLSRRHDNPEIVTEIVYGTEVIAETILAAHLARQRGEGEALDGHALLTRCKVAAALSIMAHRSVVTEKDWDLSGTVMTKSDSTRTWMLEHARQADRAKIRKRAMSQAYGEEIIDGRRAEVVRRRILRILGEGPATHGTVHSRIGKREYKELFPDVIESLLNSNEVTAEATQRGKRYSLGAGVNVDSGVKVDNPRSGTLTPRVNVDPLGDDTSFNNPSSAPGYKLVPAASPAEFLASYMASNAGQDGWIRVSQLRAAAGAAGHNWDSIRTASKRFTDPSIVSDNKGKNSSWRFNMATAEDEVQQTPPDGDRQPSEVSS
ncbi:hypothetical protein MTY66_57850 [Mycolicibacterium sp. TY66]|uniref:hypothetical protein n=1 Tax=unclassified Mycolicibacterium TaxID=2636767 RepID=UPI001BB3C4E8|nr:MULTISPECIES: hypothetical protein [unclassified Mycolicibacterium]BCI84160.1 hypothetical protein MTY66_57850 [Mycolicibacterium sp. TY66]BCJ84220.1 hypothetical protein MTY81_55930 [Mycolicibacterium sp. TY81]